MHGIKKKFLEENATMYYGTVLGTKVRFLIKIKQVHYTLRFL